MDKKTLRLLEGEGYWRIPGENSLMFSDGPHGLRKETSGSKPYGDSQQATCFPTLGALACSWNAALLYRVGEALAQECLDQGVDILLGPGVNIKRNPRCGRNFEYLSEDPLLAGELAAQYILGLQSQGIGASLKHLALNNQESFRMLNESVVDERALHEIYLKPFEIAVKKAQPWTVMSAYNRFEGINVGENKRILNILREQWGFEGLVVSDWASVNDRALGILAGMDLEMPGGNSDSVAVLQKALKDCRLQPSDIERALERIEALKEKSHNATKGEGKAQHPQLALEAALESMVLLKNEGSLPLKKGQSVALCGSQHEKMNVQGLGSSRVFTLAENNPLKTLGESLNIVPVEQAQQVILVVGGEVDSEGYDRLDLEMLPEDRRQIEELVAQQKDIILVLVGGGPLRIPASDSISAILYVPLCGDASAEALRKILLGECSPSGKLAESWPRQLSDVPSYPYYLTKRTMSYYQESLWVGYRYYSSFQKPLAWPFGHGLSYTSFDCGELTVEDQGECLLFHSSVKNEGEFASAQVVQLYLSKTDGVLRPSLELKAFAKIHLLPGEEKSLTMQVSKEQLKVYVGQWQLEAGEYCFKLGFSSEDLRREVSLDLPGVQLKDYYPPIYRSMHRPVRMMEFASLFPEEDMPMKARRRETQALTRAEIGGLIGESLDRLLIQQQQRIDGNPDRILEMLRSMPLQALSKLSRGKFSVRKLSMLVRMIRLMEAEKEFYE